MTTTIAVSPESRIVEALTDHFYLSNDGYWYPMTPGQALVRIRMSEGTYKIDRRRTPRDAWVRLAEALVAEFDAQTFSSWASTWKLVH